MSEARRYTPDEMNTTADLLVMAGDKPLGNHMRQRLTDMLREGAMTITELRGWQYLSFSSVQPDGTLLCPVCDQSERRGHAPDCTVEDWAKAVYKRSAK